VRRELEVCDRGDDQTIVAAGPLAGATLGQLVREHGAELLGRHHPQASFPLLFKFLDTAAPLSVQVHPDDALAARAATPDVGKTEAWYVVAAEPGSVFYAGLKPGVTRDDFERELATGTCDRLLHPILAQAGDCLFVPAGAMHALGSGVLVAEIQQASDTTYRLFDWNRLGADGHPRPLHVDAGLAATDFTLGPLAPSVPRPTEREQVWRLVECDKFIWDRWQLDGAATVGGDERCHILAVVEGAVRIGDGSAAVELVRGETCLLPASCGAAAVETGARAILLDAYLP